MHTKRRAFTLVELLVVIGVIGVLAAILLPAINSAVGTARKANCLNNMNQWGKAMTSYALDKQFLPGYINKLRTNSGDDVPVSWMVKILPNVEGQNLYNKLEDTLMGYSADNAKLEFSKLHDSSNPTIFINVPFAVCPSDPAEANIAGRASFVMNVGIPEEEYINFRKRGKFYILPNRDKVLNDADLRRANGVGQDLFFDETEIELNQSFSGNNKLTPADVDKRRLAIDYISSHDGTNSTIMITENVNAVTWYAIDELSSGCVWSIEPWEKLDTGNRGEIFAINVAQQNILDQNVASAWLTNNRENLVRFARPSSYHSSGVNVVFADGHGDFLSEDIDWTVYTRLMTPYGEDSDHSHRFEGTPEEFGKLLLPVSDTEMNP